LGRPQNSFAKRQREQQRRERQEQKAQKRAEKKITSPDKPGGAPIAEDELVEATIIGPDPV
jgi:hypothetical protein